MDISFEMLLLVGALCMAGGFIGGIVGVGGGILFVPAMVIALDFSHLDAEATSLLIIVVVSIVGALRQRAYGNVDLRYAAWIALLSPPGVVIGVVLANLLGERVLQLSFAGLCLFMAAQLIRKAHRHP